MTVEIQPRTRCVLNADAGTYAAGIPARQQHSGTGGETTKGVLPVWLDTDGRLRIAISMRDAEFAHDADQIILDLDEWFLGLAVAYARRPNAR